MRDILTVYFGLFAYVLTVASVACAFMGWWSWRPIAAAACVCVGVIGLTMGGRPKKGG